MILEAYPNQMIALKALLNTLADSIGLRVKYHNPSIYPINVVPEGMELLASTFGCQIGSFPFPYLGLPMGLTNQG
jgi:hypothetical protein